LDIALDHALEPVDVARDDRDAGGHRLEQDDAERFLAGIRSAEDVGAGEVAHLLVVAHPPEPFDVANPSQPDEAAIFPALRAVANDEEPCVDLPLPEAVVCLQQMDEALALLESTHEEEVQRPVAQLLVWLGTRKALQIDAVRNDPVVPGEVAVDEVHGRARDGDPAVELVCQPARESPPDPVTGAESAKGVERPDVHRLRGVEHGRRQEGNERLVEMEDVEAAALEDLADLLLEPQPERDAAD